MIGWLTRAITGGTDREIRRLLPVVERISALEPQYQYLSDDDLREKTAEFRRRLGVDDSETPATNRTSRSARGVESLDDILPEAFAAVREASRRSIGLRHFDVQLIGGMVLHNGRIAEMRTGEGKTLVASLPLYLNALIGRGCHLVTPNDYLSRVGGGWMGPVYHLLGMTTGVIYHEAAGIYDPEFQDTTLTGDERLQHWRPVTRQEAYRADITYGTNHEFGFDYLKDNMVEHISRMVQRDLHFAIVDEVDNILIDEARTPLIISGPADEPPDTWYKFAKIVTQLQEGEHYAVDLKARQVTLTDEGIDRVERLAGVPNIYDEQNYHLVHYLEQAMKAHAIFRRDRDYVLVKDGKVLDQGQRDASADVVIVDEFTGRLMFGRRYSEGLHQALEAKEGVRIQRENLTLATITFQNYFRLYKKLAGMTGTAVTEAEEFRKIYNLEVVPIPTNRPMVRQDFPDLIFKNIPAKYDAIADEIEEMHELGRPVLVGTTSVEKSEHLAGLLQRRGIPHQVLNAKLHEREALIVAQAGRKGAVTIATNMAGRGTDIILGGDHGDPEEASEVRRLGGLHIVGTERHEARRIDNQLRGRAGRQGDPGSSRFYLALDDDLMRRFGSERIAGLMERLGLEDDQPIEHSLVSKSIETAQQKVEGYNFDMRKHTVEYDDVMNKQREVIYGQRRQILESTDVKPLVLSIIRDQVNRVVEQHTESPRPDEWDIDGLFNAVAAVLGPDLGHESEELVHQNREGLQETINRWAVELYEHRERLYTPQIMHLVGQNTLLRIIDSLWQEHLTAIDDTMAGIGLRAYGQRDPLTEYKSEAYRMFQTLLADIQSSLASAIFRVQFVMGQGPPGPPPVVLEAGAAPELDQAEAIADGGGSVLDGDGALAAGGRQNGADGTQRTLAQNPALARRVAELTQPSRPRTMITNKPVDVETQHRRPAMADGKAITRAEKNRLEAGAKRQKKRDLKRRGK